MGIGRVHSLALLAILFSLPAAASDVSSASQNVPVRRGNSWQQRMEFSTPVREGGRLMLRADNGTVSIHPESGRQVTCTVTLRVYTASESEARGLFDKFQFNTRMMESGGVYISAQSPQHVRRGTRFHVQFEIVVPVHYNLDVETQAGDLTVDAPLEGEARLTTAGGDVRLGDLGGSARIETAGGNITVGNAGGDLSARTAGGAIHVGDVHGAASLESSGGEIIAGNVGGAVKAETAAGDVVVAGAGGMVIAQSAGGQIQIGPTRGGVQAETAGGNIRLQGAQGRVVAQTAGGSIDLLEVASTVRASTAAGRIMAEFNGTGRTLGPSELESSVGDVYVYLPPNLAITIDASIQTAAGHGIHTDFPLEVQGDKGDYVPTTLRCHGALNGGGEVLRIRTVAGDIEIRKIDDTTLRELKQREESHWRAWQQQHMEQEERQREKQKAKQKKEEDEDDDRQ